MIYPIDDEEKKHIILNSSDDRDPVSLKQFWIENNGIKQLALDETELNDIIMYKEYNNDIENVRLLDIETVREFKLHNICLHPISRLPIPLEIFNNIKINEKNKSIDDLANDFFLELSRITNNDFCIDASIYLEFSLEKLHQLEFEIRTLLNTNLSLEQKESLNNLNILNKMKKILIDEIREYLIDEMSKLIIIECEFKYLLVGIIVQSFYYTLNFE